MDAKETITALIEQLIKKFERHCGDTMTGTKENDWINLSIDRRESG